MAVTGTAGREESPKFGFSLLSQVLVGEVIRQTLTKAAVNPGVRPTLPRNSVHALMPHRPKPEAKIARNPGALIVNSPLAIRIFSPAPGTRGSAFPPDRTD
jgi:hypothetical protein